MQNRKTALLSVLLIALIVFCFALSTDKEEKGQQTATETENTQNEVYQVSLAALGDNLLHMPVIDSCKKPDGSYDMAPLYANIRPMVEHTDIAAIGQETVMGGEEFGYSGYPAFNSPQDAGRAIADAGFNLVLLASNHAMDMGKKGLLNTLAFWEQYPGIMTAGAHPSPEDQGRLRVIGEEIRVAVLNYTYGLNGITLSPDRAHLVDITDRERIRQDVEKASAQADFITVFMHWGKEYQHEPQPEQRELAQYMADLGVGLIIGAHPHVLGPAEWLTGLEGNRTLVYYSLGNFISSQRKAASLLGGMARLNITGVRGPDGKMQTFITNPVLTPVVTYYDKNLKNFTAYPLKSYTEELAKNHGVARFDGEPSLARFREIVDKLYPAGCGVEIDY